MSFEPVNDHIQRGLNRLISQYRESENLRSLITGLTQGIQVLEDATNEVCTELDVFSAIGTNLDNVGVIVGATRLPGESDLSFRARILATITLNVSEGQPEAVINGFNLLRGTSFVLYEEFFPGEVSLSSSSAFVDDQDRNTTFLTIDNILPAGVRLNFISTFDQNAPFAFEGNLQGLGFSSINDSTQGGFFSTIEQRGGFFAFGSVDQSQVLLGENEGFGSVNDSLVGGLFTNLQET